MTTVKPCSCSSSYQDKQYGQGKRVHNSTAKEKGWRCTVCDNLKQGE